MRTLLLVLLWAAAAQEELTLPPACPYAAPAPAPGDPLAPFSLLLTNGSTLAYPGAAALPLIVFAVAPDDPGGLLLATDAVELDLMFQASPAAAPATYLLLSYSPGGGAALQAAAEARLALLPPPRAAAWRAQLAFAAQAVPQLAGAGGGGALAAALAAWQSPRLWVTAAGVRAARVDGFYECFRWPPAAAAYELRGPFDACGPAPAGAANVSGFVLLLAGGCAASASQAVAWAQRAFPSAAGAVVPAAAPAIVGRSCDDTFADAPFFPALVDEGSGRALAAALAAAPGGALPMALNYSCAGGTALVAAAASGALAPLGWRKYTAASALLWGAQEQAHLAALAAVERGAGVAVQALLPARTPLRAAAANVTLALPVAALRAASGASLSFRLQCAGAGDGACGPWDRIVTASARCWAAGAGSASSASVEIARWITPFRRSSGAWHSPADALLGLVGNGASGAAGQWTCEVSTSTCCEEWYGQLDLLVFPPPAPPAPPPPAIPFAVLPLLFPNPATHFDANFNVNRTLVLDLPPAFTSWKLFALISGHGSDPPPPAALGCEYAPTEHVFYLGAPGRAPAAALNSSQLAPAQYLQAGAMLGCASKVPGGVIANQHGDWRDGRNGWCPGQGVAPLLFEGARGALAGLRQVEVTYKAWSFWVDLSHRSSAGCGGDIQWSAALLFY
jgi:hypothetical protein